jgi:hypothetical protein
MKLYPEPWVTWSMNSTYIFIKVDLCFTFKPWRFLKHRTSNCKIRWATFNSPLAINTNIFLQLQATLRYQRWTNTITTRLLLHAYIFDNIGLSNKNYYLWMKKIHTIRMMRIIVCTKRTINGSKPLPLRGVKCNKRRKIQTCNLP